ncbi:hypothetical protein SAMN04487772_104135 [[Clostridium] polysaccharolyticum]|uniref:Uncharacterized protein n=2 Tax=[Clostridium] polysaccharolyticum TaxID=29364 RepID=A0A1H9ZXY8_9FIRM|nr:hypothetical protein SAMN04487772_104135 [[Clostridium] polysaccharolyticum]
MHFEMEELMPLVEKLAVRYTSGESSSIPYEKARQLMEAAIFCIEEAENSSTTALNTTESTDPEKRYQIGYQCVKEKVKESLSLYDKIMEGFSYYRNRALYETVVKGMPEFFKYYNIEFEPQNRILTLDYPVLGQVYQLQGIHSIYAYLNCIQAEQTFLSALPEDLIEKALLNYHEEYEELLINVASVVLRFIIRKMLSEQWEDLKGKPIEERKEVLKNALRLLMKEKYDSNELLYQYLSLDMDEYSTEMLYEKDIVSVLLGEGWNLWSDEQKLH